MSEKIRIYSAEEQDTGFLKNGSAMYSTSTTYEKGDWCVHQDALSSLTGLYQCTEQTTGEWDPSCWTRMNNVPLLFTDENTSLMGVVRYGINSEGTILDRNINTVSSGSFEIPSGFSDLIIRFNGTPNSMTFAGGGITAIGDSVPSESGDYLITVTKVNSSQAYVRYVKI